MTKLKENYLNHLKSISFRNDSFINIDQTYFPEEENTKEPGSYILRDISSVPDVIRAVELILSNRFILKLPSDKFPPKSFENMFSLPEYSDGWNDILKDRLIYFRGQSNTEFNSVTPSLYRNKELFINENSIFLESTLASANSLTGKSIFEQLALLQHYGQATRILDITSNLLVALFFAVSDNMDKDGEIYLYDFKEANLTPKVFNDIEVIVKATLTTLSLKEKYYLYEFIYNINSKDRYNDIKEYISYNSLKVTPCLKRIIDKLYANVLKENGGNYISFNDLCGISLVLPNQTDERIIRQSGCFILYGIELFINKFKYYLFDNEKDLSDDGFKSIQKQANTQLNQGLINYSPEQNIFEKSHFPSSGYSKIIIPHKYKKNILLELEVLGIGQQSIYPDIVHKNLHIRKKYNHPENWGYN